MNFKKIIYILLTILLGLILSLILHGIIEINYINFLLKEDILPQSSTLIPQCYLPSLLQIFLLLLGLIGGYFLGHFWWKKIYENKI